MTDQLGPDESSCKKCGKPVRYASIGKYGSSYDVTPVELGGFQLEVKKSTAWLQAGGSHGTSGQQNERVSGSGRMSAGRFRSSTSEIWHPCWSRACGTLVHRNAFK